MGRRRVKLGSPQESVWECPRPPRLEDSDKRIKAVFGGVTYVPPEDIRMEQLKLAGCRSFCEWKGVARYYDIETDERSEVRAAWFYPDPVSAYSGIKDYVAFYPSLTDACWVGGEKVRAQEGDFYGGWITPDVVGPFKGGPGTWGW